MMGVSRRLAVIAWLSATILSVAVSTAAVEAVRAQVTERPDVVSLATLRRATTTTTTLQAPNPRTQAETAAPSTTTTAPETTTTTRPSVEATPATTVETIPPPPQAATPPTTAPSNQPPPDDGPDTETRTFRGGTVTVAYDGDSISVVQAIPDEGFELAVEQQGSDRLVVRFVAEGRSSALVAEVTRDGLRIRVFD
jgi:hypothetical protein